jgi:hypothetical protein
MATTCRELRRLADSLGYLAELALVVNTYTRKKHIAD